VRQCLGHEALGSVEAEALAFVVDNLASVGLAMLFAAVMHYPYKSLGAAVGVQPARPLHDGAAHVRALLVASGFVARLALGELRAIGTTVGSQLVDRTGAEGHAAVT